MYFNGSGILGQSYFNGGSWQNTFSEGRGEANPPWTYGIGGAHTILPLQASPYSRLSISTNVIPPTVKVNDSSRQFNNSFESPNSLLSSVATYQTANSAVMIDLVGNTWKNQSVQIGSFDNLFSQFTFLRWDEYINPSNSSRTTTALNTSLLSDFACAYNEIQDLDPLENSYGVPLGLRCISPHVYASAIYGPYELGQATNNIHGFYSGEHFFAPLSTVKA